MNKDVVFFQVYLSHLHCWLCNSERRSQQFFYNILKQWPVLWCTANHVPGPDLEKVWGHFNVRSRRLPVVTVLHKTLVTVAPCLCGRKVWATILNTRHPSVKYPPSAHCSFACFLTVSSAVHFSHQAFRSLTAVSRSSLWLIAQQEVNNMAQTWCDFKASAKTPALTIYNTLEASQRPTLPSSSVGSTSLSLPLSFSSPPGSAILVTKLLLCNWLNDSIDP